jgi:hypothetical protein
MPRAAAASALHALPAFAVALAAVRASLLNLASYDAASITASSR